MPKKSKGDFEVGYGKPPKSSQFKKGQSGNPKGRPRKLEPLPLRKRALQDVFMDCMHETRTVTISGKEKTLSNIELHFQSIVNSALKGKASSQKLLHQMLEKFDRESTQNQAMLIERFAQLSQSSDGSKQQEENLQTIVDSLERQGVDREEIEFFAKLSKTPEGH